MADFNQVEKEAETGVAESHYSEDEVQQGIPSPVDCWELVGSSPGSPLPEARGDVTALEEAIASACNSDSLLQDNYFRCAHGLADDGVLPVSTTMTDKQNDYDGNSSERSDGIISLASDTDAIGNCTIGNDSMFHGNRVDDVELVGHHDGMHHDDQMHDNDIYHDNVPHCRNLMCYDDQVQHSVDVLQRHKMHDEFMMYPNEFIEHADRWHLEDETHFEVIMHIEGDSARSINHLGHSCGIVESMAGTNVHHDVCTSGVSSGLESPSRSSMSLRGAAGDIDMSKEQVFAEEGSNSTVLTGREATSEVLQAPESVDVQHGTISTYNKKQRKGFVYVSWIWTQLIRWQTQLGHANTIWSVALAAAVMGILVLGRGWHSLQAQNQSLRSQLWAKEKRITQLMFQLMQTKDALANVRRVPVICVKPSLQIPQDNF